jgi:hypothetical protein
MVVQAIGVLRIMGTDYREEISDMKDRISIGVLAAWLLWAALPVSASTVLEMDFPEVVDAAELVFMGEVLSVESRQTGPRRIHTVVRFRVIEVLKGDYSGDTLELRYLGGEINGRRMQVTDMEWPEAGENGMYFVESLRRSTVHPLVGWSQGHYRIENDAQGQARVFTADRRPVTGVSALEPGESQAAMRAGEFRSRVREMVNAAGTGREARQ